MGRKGVRVFLARFLSSFLLPNKIDLEFFFFLHPLLASAEVDGSGEIGGGQDLGLGVSSRDLVKELRALAMVDGVAVFGDDLDLRSSVSWPDQARPQQDSMLCRYPRKEFSYAKPLPPATFVITWKNGDFFISDFNFGAGSCEGFNQWRSQFEWNGCTCIFSTSS